MSKISVKAVLGLAKEMKEVSCGPVNVFAKVVFADLGGVLGPEFSGEKYPLAFGHSIDEINVTLERHGLSVYNTDLSVLSLEIKENQFVNKLQQPLLSAIEKMTKKLNADFEASLK